MKIVGYSALAYGTEYLAWAIRSVIDHVHEYHVLYAAQGSYGHRTSEPCPDSRDDLMSIAQAAADSKLRWHDGEWTNEGAHRSTIHEVAPDADIIVRLDFDEIWQPGLLQEAIDAAIHGSVYKWRVPFRHYWRSFYRCILYDPSFPDVIYNTHNPHGTEDTLPTDKAVNHMGYAIRPELARWKWLIHGHKNEERRDVDWFADKYLMNAQYDTHPVGSDYWNPKFIDPWQYLPEFMRQHPYANMEVIE